MIFGRVDTMVLKKGHQPGPYHRQCLIGILPGQTDIGQTDMRAMVEVLW